MQPQKYWTEDGLRQIESTGYSADQLLMIEIAFSKGICNGCKSGENYTASDEQNFYGLMSIIEALDTIHQNINPATTEAAKRKFSPSVL